MSHYGRFAPYVPVAERRRKAALAAEKLRKKGHSMAPVLIEGRAIAATPWGKAWCSNLEGYRDYESRLPRGRTYVRNGSVIDLQVAPLAVTALVSGSSIYKVTIRIGAVAAVRWKSICTDCAGGIDSLVELLQGRLSKGVMERRCRQDGGLFPTPSDIGFSCSCPDHASMCKHVAAVLYGVGARLDRSPALLFRLRAVDEKDLLANLDHAMPAAPGGAGKLLDEDDVSALFGLEMATEAPAAPASKAASARNAKTTAAPKPAASARSAKAKAVVPPAKPAPAAKAKGPNSTAAPKLVGAGRVGAGRVGAGRVLTRQ